MFSFLNASMSTATQRYLSFTLGTGDREELKRIFSTSFIIHCCIAIFLLTIAESVGVWFVNNKLNVPLDRLTAANWIFQFSMLSMALTIIQVPFNALLIAHEKMNIYCKVGVSEYWIVDWRKKSVEIYLFDFKEDGTGYPYLYKNVTAQNKEDLHLVMFPNLKITFDELFDIGEY